MSTSSSPNLSHQRWVDIARVLGTFLVVMTHTEYFGQRLGLPFYYSITRVAVPLFFMTSGLLLLSKVETLQDFFRKRAIKVLIPMIAWSVIYLVWKGEGFDKPLFSIIATYAVRIMYRPSSDHLWFLYALLGLYLFTPILRLYLQKASWLDQIYYLSTWFFFTTIVFFLGEFTRIKIGIYYQYLSGYIGYFLFGYFAGNFPIQKKHKIIAWFVFFLGLIITISGMWYCQNYGVKSQYFEDYLSMNVVLMSWSLFVLLKDLEVSDNLYKMILPLSQASFGIYLIHIIVIVEFYHSASFSNLTKIGHEIYMEPILGIIAFLISFFIVFILQKIPILRGIVP